MKTLHLLFCSIGLLVLTETVDAAEINFGKDTPTASQVIDALDPETDDQGDSKPKVKTRSIDMSAFSSSPESSKKKVKKAVNNELQKVNSEIALSMEILFDYKSSALTQKAQEQLKPVGEAMVSDKLKNLGFIVEGHTDAVGGDAYNKSLSEQRADSVKRYLVETFNINPTRVQIVGKGKSGLLDTQNPSSEVNRRVRIVAIR